MMVVLPALSRPLQGVSRSHEDGSPTHRNRILISFSFLLFLRMIVRSPIGESVTCVTRPDIPDLAILFGILAQPPDPGWFLVVS